MPKAKQNHAQIPKDRYFLLGFGLFFLGVIGTFFWLQQDRARQVSHLLSTETLALLELKLSVSNLEFLNKNFNLTTGEMAQFPGLSREFSWDELAPWLGADLRFSWLPEQKFLHAFDYRRRPEAKAFLRTFLLPEETLATQESDYGLIYTPSYSSTNAFVFYKGWLLWADSPETLRSQLGSDEKLYKYGPYRQLSQDLPNLKFARMYANFSGNTSAFANQSDNQALGPLMQGLGRSTPHWGMTFHIKDGQLQGDLKVLTHEAVYDENQNISKAENQTIPDLAYFAPKNTLFFQNGHDLYAKYQHTKNYLNELDPQLSLVFEGLIRAQSETWFGSEFDFETEFLELIRGQYAFVLDFNQGLEIGFISALSDQQDPTAINELIQKAQSRFTPILESVELPDGTVRQELVAADPQNIPISKQTLNGQDYYTSNRDDGTINFSYTQMDGYLVMANRVNLVEKIITTKQDQTKSLAANQDFRRSVLFLFSPAEVYGFLNAPKLNQLNFHWAESSGHDSPFDLSWIGSLRNATFSKQVFPEAMFMKIRLFFND